MLRLIRSLIDPSEAALTSEPRSKRDLFISARNAYMHCIDNVSTLSQKMADAYCRLVTEGVFRTRKLFSDYDEAIIKAKQPVAFNGITSFANQNDFLDRSIVMRLLGIDPAARQPERDFWEAWQLALPRVLGAFYDAVSAALKNQDQVQLASMPRMADFARWVAAAEPACPWQAGEFERVYESNRNEIIDTAIEDDPIGEAVLYLLRDKAKWSGTPTELLRVLKKVTAEELQKDTDWPKAPNALSARLMRLEGFLASKKVAIARDRRPEKRWGRKGLPSNKSLQVTFDPPRTFAVAKARVASNAPELRR